MIDTLLNLAASHPASAIGLAIIAIAALVALFGRERAWEALVAVWRSLRRGGAPALIVLVGAGLVGGCAAFPRTTAAYNSGGVEAAIDTFLTQAHARVVTLCRFADRPQIASVIDLAGDVAGLGELVADTRVDRQAWCTRLGGSASIEIQ